MIVQIEMQLVSELIFEEVVGSLEEDTQKEQAHPSAQSMLCQ